MYHWVKYVKKDVSIVFETHVENYVPKSTVPVLEQNLTNKPLDKFHPKPLVVESASCHKFICDFMHFTVCELSECVLSVQTIQLIIQFNVLIRSGKGKTLADTNNCKGTNVFTGVLVVCLGRSKSRIGNGLEF